MRRLFGMMCLFILCAYGSTQANTIVDFEDWAGGDENLTTAISGGFSFVAGNGDFQIYASGSGSDNLTKTLHAYATSIPSLTMAKLGGGTFNIDHLDLQDGFSWISSTSVTLTGFFPGGGTISQTLALDGNVQTYETFYPSGFSGL